MLKRFPVLLGAAAFLLLSLNASAQDDGKKPDDAAAAAENETAGDDSKSAGEEKFDVEKAMVSGKTVYFADRGITLPGGTAEARVDLFVGLNKGLEGKMFGVASGLASERNSGLTFRGGIYGPFEAGMSLQYMQTTFNGRNSRTRGNADGTMAAPTVARGPEGDGTIRNTGYGYKLADGYNHLVPAYLYGRFRVVEQFGVELGIIIPTMQADGWNRPTLRLGFPVQWVAVKGLLKLHIRPDLLIGFGTDAPYDPTMLDSVVNLGIYVDAGVTISVANLFMDFTVAYGGDVYPYKKGYIPLTMLFGYQVLPRLDVFAGFTLSNLIPEYGSAGDARSLTMGFQCRF